MQAREILIRSNKEAEDKKRESELLAKDELYKLRSSFEKETQEKKVELQKLEKRLIAKEENIDNKVDIIDKKELAVHPSGIRDQQLAQ